MAARDIVIIALVLFCVAVGLFISSHTSTTILSSMRAAPNINDTPSAVAAIDSAQASVDKADYWYFGIFIALCLALIITGWFIGGHPIFMIVYFFFIVLAIIISAVLANSWETLSADHSFILTIIKFPITNNIIMNLPIYVSIVGFIGLLAMFAKPMFSEATPP